MNASILFRIKTRNFCLEEGGETVKNTVTSPDQQGSGLRTEAKQIETPRFCVKQVTNRNIPVDLVTPLNHKTLS